MVKIERKDTDKARQAIQSLASEELKISGKCNTPEVVEALEETFHGKCYICESEQSPSKEVEHLIPHGGDKTLKFDWNNLFLACTHCNHIKGNTYTPILDCTRTEVDELIAFRKIGYFGIDEVLSFTAVDDKNNDPAINMTCALLQRVHYGKTKQEEFGAKILRKTLMYELLMFKEYIRDYNQATGEDKRDLFESIRMKLKNNSSFSAFKRWLIKDNPTLCGDFTNCWKKY